MEDKFLTIDNLKLLEVEVESNNITYSRMVEIINEMAYDYYRYKIINIIESINQTD